ncbi:hypothetical protein [Micromonospora haikouensis]|uniref:hypothetical protein n=1 Tax=Micromonospora haikouensis TaxID=686309 RepID=UPI003D74DFF3
MGIRYFEIRSPRPDFTGRIGAVSFADGVARVSFDDDRDDAGMATVDEHRVQVGRSAVLFAQRRPGYLVIEVDSAGNPLADKEQAPRRTADSDLPSRSASKVDWVRYATSPHGGMTEADADAMTRDALADKYLGPKGS